MNISFAVVSVYATKIAIALFLLWLGLLVIRKISAKVSEALTKKYPGDLSSFLAKLTGTLLKVLLLISLIDYLGIPTTSFVAIIGASALAVGLALQGSLANFAGGVLLLLFRPFKSGDFIEGAGYMGTVEEISIFFTRLATVDNKVIFIPNGQLSNSGITNFSAKELRRVDMTFGTGYECDTEKTKTLLKNIAHEHPAVLSDPEPFVRMGELADSSVNYTVRVWTKAADYWTVYFDFHEKVKEVFDRENISIPFPQMDVHLDK